MPLLAFIGGVVALVASTVYGGYVFTWLWYWFAVPLGAPQIGIAMAIGLRLLILQVPRRDKAEESDFAGGLIYGLVMTTMIWAIGFIASLFV